MGLVSVHMPETNFFLSFYSFSSLVSRANKWLRENGQVRAKVCESIEVKGRYDGVVDTHKSSYFEGDHIKKKMRNMYIRALRYTKSCYTLFKRKDESDTSSFFFLKN